MTTLPQASPQRGLARLSWPLLVAAALIIALLGTLVVRFVLADTDPLAGGTPLAVSRAPLIDGISATGAVAPRLESQLTFATRSGRVVDVLVDEGDRVALAQPLVQLEIAQLDAAVAAAEARVAQARADLTALEEGATAAEVAQARAQVAAAQAGLTEAQGQVTPQQISAARAELEAARAELVELEAGPRTSEVRVAQADLASARAALGAEHAALQATRDERSSAKLAAERELEAATLALQQAQSEYSEAYWRFRGVEQDGRVPESNAGERNRELTEYGNLSQEEAFKRAELKLREAELGLRQAQDALEQARREEITAIQQGEQQVARAEAELQRAQADLDELLNGADADEIAAARARVTRAESDLAQLQGAERQGRLQASEAGIAEAQAGLDQLLEDPLPSELARATAAVAQAEAELKQARVDLDNATLRAPFAGTVAEVSVAPGETIDQVAPITLIDDSAFEIELTVDEVDVARVAVGQPVEVLIDALGQPALSGRVRTVAPSAVSGETVRTYAVTVDIEPGQRPLRPGMTASATIVASRRDNALSLPLNALREENGRQFVDLVQTDADGNTTVRPQEVTTGLRVGDRIEILSGLEDGQQVLVPAANDE